jgi:hypothetical protein
MGWLGAAATTVALLAVLVSAAVFLSPPAFAGPDGQDDGLVSGPFSVVEPPLPPTGPALPAQTGVQARPGEGTPELLLRDWNYTGGGNGKPKPSPGH